MAAKPGRRFAFDDEKLATLEKLAGYGMTQEQIGDFFSISERTFRAMKAEDERIDAAYKRGRAKRLAFVTGKLAELINQGDKASIYFYLKTKWGWRETNRLEVDTELPVITIRRHSDGNAE